MNEQVDPLISLNQLSVGTVIAYRLRPTQGAIDPGERWRGKIIETFQRRGTLLDMVLVELLDKGYEDEIETVLVEQIVEIEHERELGQGDQPGRPSGSPLLYAAFVHRFRV